MRFLEVGDKIEIPCRDEGIMLHMHVGDKSTLENRWYFLVVDQVTRLKEGEKK